jgi:hypothetical protein
MRDFALATVLAFGVGCSPAPSPSPSRSGEEEPTEQPPLGESSCEKVGEVSFECFCSEFDCKVTRDEFLTNDSGWPVFRQYCGSIEVLRHSGLELAFENGSVVAGCYADDVGYLMSTPDFPRSPECSDFCIASVGGMTAEEGGCLPDEAAQRFFEEFEELEEGLGGSLIAR